MQLLRRVIEVIRKRFAGTAKYQSHGIATQLDGTD
jgi:hypothetical protein